MNSLLIFLLACLLVLLLLLLLLVVVSRFDQFHKSQNLYKDYNTSASRRCNMPVFIFIFFLSKKFGYSLKARLGPRSAPADDVVNVVTL